LQQIAPHVVPAGIHKTPDPVKRANLVCEYAEKLDCKKFVTPQDILNVPSSFISFISFFVSCFFLVLLIGQQIVGKREIEFGIYSVSL
jgi:hypothetical protein